MNRLAVFTEEVGAVRAVQRKVGSAAVFRVLRHHEAVLLEDAPAGAVRIRLVRDLGVDRRAINSARPGDGGLKQPLKRLAEIIPWEKFKDEYGDKYSPNGRPAKPMRLMVGLLILSPPLKSPDSTSSKLYRVREFSIGSTKNGRIRYFSLK